MRDAVRGMALGLALLVVVGAFARRAGWVALQLPDLGTAPWLLSRASGLTAWMALGADVALGLAVSTRLGDRWLPRAASIELHRWLSPITLALVAGHALVLLADRYVRFELADALIPFVAPYRPLAVGLGVLAGYLALVVHVSFSLRRRLGARTWRRLHALSFVAFVAAAAHAWLAGTDASQPWARLALAGPLGLVVGLVAYRVARARARAAAIREP